MLKFLERINRAMRGDNRLEGLSAADESRELVNVTPAGIGTRIVARSLKEDAPEWKREYTATFCGGFRIKVEMHSFLGRRDSSRLIQPNGKYIFFDCDAVADEIIDRELCATVEALVADILAMDRAFMASHPNRFTDKNGDVWQRVA